MGRYKVSLCIYEVNNGKRRLTGFTVNGNTEAAVKQYLKQLHGDREFLILELVWD